MVKNKNISIHDPVTKEKLLIFKSKFSALKFIITTQFYGENIKKQEILKNINNAINSEKIIYHYYWYSTN